MTNLTTFVPFQHDNAESINKFLAFARNQFTEDATAQGALASALIYTNFVDYLAANLLENLRNIIFRITYKCLNGVVYYDSDKEKVGKPLGHIINDLNKFHFPDKVAFIERLTAFNEHRNNLIHSLMKIDLDKKAEEVDSYITNIRREAEEILERYNTITKGINDIYNNAIK